MSILKRLTKWLNPQRARQEWEIEPISTEDMDRWVSECIAMYKGNPSWLNPDDGIDTVNFAKTICAETARLATMGIGIHLDGSSRADWLQGQIDSVYYQLRQWVEYGCAYGTVILKPNGATIDLYTREDYVVTHATGDRIDGVLFCHSQKVKDDWYTRLEHHRFEGDMYLITNRCYVGASPGNTEKPVDIESTPWAGLAEDVAIENLEAPLFGVLRMPNANNIDLGSPYGLPVFSEAVQELRDLDIAYSRNATEIGDSKRTVLLDSDALIPNGTRLPASPMMWEHKRTSMGLPDMVKNVRGDGREMFYQEINPTLNTEVRINGINALLNQIGYKCGFSNGHFVFDAATGIQTATGVEASQQRTIQYTKDIRDQLENCMNGLIYALSKFADLYDLAPVGDYEVVYDFGDITYNREEDRSRWWGYVIAGKIPFWYYLVKFEGMTEEEAKLMEQEAKPKAPTLFGSEE